MIATAPQPSTTGTDTDLTHLYCCDPDIAICGEDLSGTPEVDEDGQLCVVCEDLEFQPCACAERTHP